MKKLVIILDPAHGADVKGKQSPDGSHKEYLWSRNIINKMKPLLERQGFEVFLSNQTINEIGLTKRANYATNLKVNPGQYKLLISFHNNAAGSDGRWYNARGVEIYTSSPVTMSDKFSTIALNQLKVDFPALYFRYGGNNPNDLDKDRDFTVLTGKGYYSMLVEWLFQDNELDVALLRDSTVNQRFIDSMVKAINEMERSLA